MQAHNHQQYTRLSCYSENKKQDKQHKKSLLNEPDIMTYEFHAETKATSHNCDSHTHTPKFWPIINK